MYVEWRLGFYLKKNIHVYSVQNGHRHVTYSQRCTSSFPPRTQDTNNNTRPAISLGYYYYHCIRFSLSSMHFFVSIHQIKRMHHKRGRFLSLRPSYRKKDISVCQANFAESERRERYTRGLHMHICIHVYLLLLSTCEKKSNNKIIMRIHYVRLHVSCSFLLLLYQWVFQSNYANMVLYCSGIQI